MSSSRLIAVVLACALAGCAGGDTGARAKPAKATATNCEHVEQLFDMLVKKKAEGWTERQALADMSERGEYAFGGPLVDSVFGTRFGEAGSALAKSDMLRACKRVAAGGTL